MPATPLHPFSGPLLLWVLAFLAAFGAVDPGVEIRGEGVRRLARPVPQLDATIGNDEPRPLEHVVFRKPATPVPLPPADPPQVAPAAPGGSPFAPGPRPPCRGSSAVKGSAASRAPPALA